MSVFVSLCVIRIEVCEDQSETKTDEGVAMSSQKTPRSNRGRRQVKDMTVETYSSSDNTSSPVSLLRPETSKKEKSKKSNSKEVKSLPTKEKDEETRSNVVDLRSKPIPFVSGNPFVEVTRGLLHLYKKDKLTDIDHESFDCQIVCILAVPATMTCHDLMNYTQGFHNEIEHIRIIRDGSPNQYMALMYFRTKESTTNFFRTYNGTPFNSFEEYICQLVFVSRVEVLNETAEVWSPPTGHTEIPTCSICLERMDESVKGVLTVLCNHSFHSSCLVKWGDLSCPVCRHVQTPEVVAENACFECHSSESLWICLICGHIGCSRYFQGHAQKHYVETSHCFSMQLGSNRVWDYVGDNFVHRLLQNKTDGKLVEGPSPEKHNNGQTPDVDEKLDSFQLEYTYLLTSQLDSQRIYYEARISKLQEENKQKSSLEAEVQKLSKEKHILDKKIHNLSTKLALTQSQLNEEKELSRALQSNQATWQEKFNALENEFKQYKNTKELQLTELKDQLRDVMFYFEAQKKIGESKERDEIAEGTIVIAESSTPNSASKSKRRTRKR